MISYIKLKEGKNYEKLNENKKELRIFLVNQKSTVPISITQGIRTIKEFVNKKEKK